MYRTEIENCEYDIHQLIFYFHMLASLYSERYYMKSLVRNINIIYYSLSISTSTSTSTYRTLTIHTHTHTTSQTNNHSNQTMALNTIQSPLSTSFFTYQVPQPPLQSTSPNKPIPQEKKTPHLSLATLPLAPCSWRRRIDMITWRDNRRDALTRTGTVL